MANDFGDFKEIKESNNEQQEQEAPIRVRLPRNNEIIGIVVQRLGGNRMEVKSTDNKTRNCRVPGRFKRKFWLRQGDFVLITPWEHDNSKGDIVYQYNSSAVNQLKKRGLISNLIGKF